MNNVPEPVKKTMISILDGWKRQLETDKQELARREEDVSSIRERMATLWQAITETEVWLGSNDDKVAGGD